MKYKVSYILVFVSLLIVYSSCKRKHQLYFDDYSRNEAGLYYKMLKIGDGDYKVGPWDDVTFTCSFKKLNDSVFFSSSREKIYFNPEDSLQKTLFVSHFLGLVEGDSISYYVKTQNLFTDYFQVPVPDYCKNDSLIRVDVRISHLEKEVKISETELKTIKDYIAQKDLDEVVELPNKIFVLERKTSESADKVTKGRTVVLSYKGRFLNDSLFDAPFYPLQFVYGTPDQVLKGINFVIKGMSKGEYAKIILPSYLAYGERGNSNATVPPFTPLLYEITITDIK
ncbi:MAG: FKBP-type peptidyl-prolyl cis-trans isomerase [Bacteroidetes bacterium]|nr:FKBP-type peptidyl-prolyl cis-trans isomerase [Bacteroidota bacterium]